MTMEIIRTIVRSARDRFGFDGRDRAAVVKEYSPKIGLDAVHATINAFDDLVIDRGERAKLIRMLKLDKEEREDFNRIVGSDGKRLFRLRFAANYPLVALAHRLSFTPSRFAMDDLEQLVMNRLNAKYADYHDPRPLAVVIYPKSDWNGAFSWFTGFYKMIRSHSCYRKIGGKLVSSMKSESSSGRYVDNTLPGLMKFYRVLYYEAKNERELVAYFKQATQRRKASLVIFGGHGNQNVLALGAADPALSPVKSEKFYLDISDRQDLKGLSKRLVKGAHIVLHSCSNAAGGPGAHNMVNMMVDVFPGDFIHAVDSITSVSLRLDKKGRFMGLNPTVGNMVVMRRFTPEEMCSAIKRSGGADCSHLKKINAVMYFHFGPGSKIPPFPHPEVLSLTKIRKRLGGKTPNLSKALKHPDGFVRQSILRLMSRQKDTAQSIYFRILKDPSPQVRLEAMRLIARNKTLKTARAVARFLSDRNESVRKKALETLIGLGRWSGVILADTLLNGMRDDVRAEVVHLIGELDYKGAVGALLWASGFNYTLDIAIAKAFGKIADTRAIPNLVGLLVNSRRDVRWAARRSLDKMPGPAAVEELLSMMKHGFSRSRQLAAAYMRDEYYNEPEVIKAFIKALEGKDTAIRSIAVDTLRKSSDPKAKVALKKLRLP